MTDRGPSDRLLGANTSTARVSSLYLFQGITNLFELGIVQIERLFQQIYVEFRILSGQGFDEFQAIGIGYRTHLDVRTPGSRQFLLHRDRKSVV